jgi:hypothetical protein
MVFPVPVAPFTICLRAEAARGQHGELAGRCPPKRMTAPATNSPPGVSSGTAPGAATRALAVRTRWRPCRSSKLTAAAGDRSAACAAIEASRSAHAPIA